MLSYQHIYHAGNLADVHKHALLAWSLAYLTRKDKPVTYIETHGGRGLYDLSDMAAQKTGEAMQGVEKVLERFDKEHPYARVIAEMRAQHGPQAYAGSPMFAAQLLRESDRIHIAELHPREVEALRNAMSPYAVNCYHQNGFDLAHSLCPPTPRRGLMLIDPSYELKTDYDTIPKHIAKISKAWNVGVICVWYPLLKAGLHDNMLKKLVSNHPDALRHEVRFPPAKTGHGMIGSGMFVINPPFGLSDEAKGLSQRINAR